MVGAVALRWWVVPRAVGVSADDDLASSGARAARYGQAASVLALPALALVFARQLAEFRDPFVPWSEDAVLLLQGTAWGTAFLLACVATVLAVFAFRRAAVAGRGGWTAATALALGLATFPSFTGHANAGEGTARAMTLVSDIAHVWAAGAWLGGLAGLLWLDHRARRAGGGPALEALVPAFSPLAVSCVAVLAATGILASWVHLPDPWPPWAGAYGRALAIKLLLVGLVLALGWNNWRRLTPRMTTPDGAAALRNAALAELAIAQLVLMATAVLVRTPPAG